MSVIFYTIFFLAHLCALCLGSDDEASIDVCGENGPGGVGYEYSNLTRHCYKLHTQATNWNTANWLCAGEGGRLAVPNSNEEARVLTEIFKKYPDTEITDADYPNYALVGLYNKEAGGWLTVDGQTLQQAGYAVWAQGETGTGAYKYYAFINRYGKLGDTYETLRHPFFCEKAPAPKCW